LEGEEQLLPGEDFPGEDFPGSGEDNGESLDSQAGDEFGLS
jgi:hypothetical protein